MLNFLSGISITAVALCVAEWFYEAEDVIAMKSPIATKPLADAKKPLDLPEAQTQAEEPSPHAEEKKKGWFSNLAFWRKSKKDATEAKTLTPSFTFWRKQKETDATNLDEETAAVNDDVMTLISEAGGNSLGRLEDIPKTPVTRRRRSSLLVDDEDGSPTIEYDLRTTVLSSEEGRASVIRAMVLVFRIINFFKKTLNRSL